MEEAQRLRAKAAQARRLGFGLGAGPDRERLIEMADDFENRADRADAVRGAEAADDA